MKGHDHMKDDKREILYRFRANKAESSMIEARYIQSSCSSISEFFRQIVINDMIVQSSEEELKNLNLLLKSIAQSVDELSEESSCTHSAKIQEVKREVDAAWQQLQSIQFTLRKLKH